MSDALTLIPQGEAITLIGRPPLQPPFGMDFRTWFEYKKGLENKRSVVRSQVKRIAKNGHNQQQGYRYAEAADIYDQINDIMHEAKLGFSAEYLRDEVVFAKNGAPINKVYLLITWTDLDNGYFEQQEIAGFGLDYGDKGIYKAYTGAAKYSLVLNFLIPTGDDPARGAMDPENDKQETPQNSAGAAQTSGGSNNNRSNARSSSGQTGSRGSGSRSNQPPKDETPPPLPPEEKQQSSNQPNDPPSDPPAEPGPIKPEQIGQIKIMIGKLSEFSGTTPEIKSQANKATYTSVAVKLKIKELDEKSLPTLDEKQAEIALYCLDQWLAAKEKKRQEQEAKQAEQDASKAEETTNQEATT